MTYPSDSRNAVQRIFSQKGAVIRNPLRSAFPVPEIGAKAPQKEWHSHCGSAVANISAEIGETPIITFGCSGEKVVRCTFNTHCRQRDNDRE